MQYLVSFTDPQTDETQYHLFTREDMIAMQSQIDLCAEVAEKLDRLNPNTPSYNRERNRVMSEINEIMCGKFRMVALVESVTSMIGYAVELTDRSAMHLVERYSLTGGTVYLPKYLGQRV